MYPEDGDAGDRFNPQNITGGPYCGISGDIGGQVLVVGDGEPFFVNDGVDAFKFYYTGGHFSGLYDPPSGVTRALYHADDLSNPISHSGDDWGTQPAGNYVFELTAAGDPPFTFGLFIDLQNPDADRLPLRAPAVPAPGALALMLAGLAGLGASRRRVKTI
jgi:hypothetical protein